MSKRYFALAVLGILFAAGYWMAAEPPPPKVAPDQQFKDGNFKEAYNEFRKRTLDPKADRLQVGKDLHQAVAALQRLGRDAEADEYREAVLAVHKDNWRLLSAAAGAAAASTSLLLPVTGCGRSNSCSRRCR